MVNLHPYLLTEEDNLIIKYIYTYINYVAMCYDIKVSFEAQLKRAKQSGDWVAVEEIMERLIPYTDLPIHHMSGFNHPEILIYTDEDPSFPIVATWGLIPDWVYDEEQKENIWKKTLNARGETIFEKKSFKKSAKQRRCLIYIDGFYEHHHYNGKTYPFYIYNKNKEPLTLAGLWNEWTKPTGGKFNSFSIVTTKANKLLAKIHNNPKLDEPRMPLILNVNQEKQWLKKINNEEDEIQIKKLITPFSDDLLDKYTVPKLRGKNYLGNVEEINLEFIYDELIF